MSAARLSPSDAARTDDLLRTGTLLPVTAVGPADVAALPALQGRGARAFHTGAGLRRPGTAGGVRSCCTAFFTPEGYDGMRQTIISVGDSIGFTALRALPSHMEGIYQRITGGHFVFYQNSGTFTEKREVWLCRSGKAETGVRNATPFARIATRSTSATARPSVCRTTPMTRQTSARKNVLERVASEVGISRRRLKYVPKSRSVHAR